MALGRDGRDRPRMDGLSSAGCSQDSPLTARALLCSTIIAIVVNLIGKLCKKLLSPSLNILYITLFTMCIFIALQSLFEILAGPVMLAKHSGLSLLAEPSRRQ